jgi:hypothetical protein
MSHAAISRVEWGHSPHVPIERLARLADVVGLDLTLRAYPSGDPVRDAGQIALLRRFRARIHPSLGWTTEVPLPIPGDRRAWDACVDGQGWRLPIEAETSLHDLQALDRRLAIKARDGGVDRLIVVVNGSHANRRVLSATRESLRGRFPLDTRAVLAALADAVRPRASGIVVL